MRKAERSVFVPSFVEDLPVSPTTPITSSHVVSKERPWPLLVMEPESPSPEQTSVSRGSSFFSVGEFPALTGGSKV